MNFFSHISYPFVIVSSIYLFIGAVPVFNAVLILLLCSTAPDFDGLVYILKRRSFEDPDHPFLHHTWPTHWPITYSWTIVLTLLFPSPITFAMVIGFYSHMGLDSIGCGDGMAWFAPFTMKMINLGGKRWGTEGYHGKDWFDRFRNSPLFLAEKVITCIALGFLIYWIIQWTM